jgi:hypothetical protein
MEGEIKATIAPEFSHIYEVAIHRGDVARLCDDPSDTAQDELAACVMRRENQFRAELGLPLGKHYGLAAGPEAARAYQARWVEGGIRIVLPTDPTYAQATADLAYAPWSLPEVQDLSRSAKSARTMLTVLQESGITFTPDAGTLRGFKDIGAPREVLDALASARRIETALHAGGRSR